MSTSKELSKSALQGMQNIIIGSFCHIIELAHVCSLVYIDINKICEQGKWLYYLLYYLLATNS